MKSPISKHEKLVNRFTAHTLLVLSDISLTIYELFLNRV